MSQLWAALIGAMQFWHQVKLFIQHSLLISHDSVAQPMITLVGNQW